MAAGIRTAGPLPRLAAVMAGVGAYVLAFAVLYPLTGPSTTAWIIVPVGLAGWLLGAPGSLIFGLLSVPLNIFLFIHVGRVPDTASLVVSVFASILFTLIGLAAAWIRTHLDRVDDRTRELQEEHRILSEEMEKRVALEGRLIHQALHDPLTNLPNRRLFCDRLEHAHTHARNRHHPDALFAVVYLDFDRFKTVNDSLGHEAGDQVLIEIARRLKHSVRATDTVARMGGDEFVILLEGIRDDAETLAIVRRIRDKLTAPFEVLSRSVEVTASLGVVINLADYEKVGDIMRDADLAMYRAKACGTNCFEVFESAMRAGGEDARLPANGPSITPQDRPEYSETLVRWDLF